MRWVSFFVGRCAFVRDEGEKDFGVGLLKLLEERERECIKCSLGVVATYDPPVACHDDCFMDLCVYKVVWCIIIIIFAYFTCVHISNQSIIFFLKKNKKKQSECWGVTNGCYRSRVSYENT